MNKRRDDFPKKVIELLKTRAGNKCSNPHCRVVTNGPDSSFGIINIGVAAHICAAAPNGPRYDMNMTVEERKSYGNGIWLCTSCSTKIDRDISFYTIDLLNEWKRLAEAEAHLAIGSKIYNEEYSSDMLAMALSGYPKKFIVDTIRNTHKATSKALEKLDDRFIVDSSYDNGITRFNLNAVEPVSLKVNFKRSKKYTVGYQRLLRQGEPFEINPTDIKTSGSLLIDEILQQPNGKLILQAQSVNAVLKLRLNNKESMLVDSVDDINGELRYGTEALSFKGGCFNGLLNINAIFPHGGNSCKFNMNIDFEIWAEQEVLKLPYFKKIKSTYDKIVLGWAIDFKIEIEGVEVLSGNCDKASNNFYKRLCTLLSYTDSSRELSLLLNKAIPFDSSITFTADEHRDLRRAVRLLKADNTKDISHFNSLPEFKLLVSDENIDLIKSGMDKKGDFAIESECIHNFMVFKQEIKTHIIREEFLNVTYCLDKDVDRVNIGDTIKVKLMPKEDFMYIEKYVK
ncbi:hypothetical protein [Cronobacter sakazakii]|uniref:hypothetical protein n=1 Tax=Cronobacter sakazakii TaxID=28141 RepID=UPI0015C539AE|nr:hypothetical protein [Cronobacter sakazakii]